MTFFMAQKSPHMVQVYFLRGILFCLVVFAISGNKRYFSRSQISEECSDGVISRVRMPFRADSSCVVIVSSL